MRNASRLLIGAPLLLSSMIACGPKPAASSNPPEGATDPVADGGGPLTFDASNLTLIKGTVTRTDPSTVATTALTEAVTANNAFALAIYPLVSSGTSGNFLTSPVSASMALTMTYAGASAQTATEMATALQLPSSGASIFDGENALSAALNGRAAAALAADTSNSSHSTGPAPSADNYAVEVVNSVWGQKGYSWTPAFLNVLSGSYGTGVYEEDFESNPLGALDTINSWVSAKTSGKIYPLLSKAPPAIDSLTRLVLVNAVHAKLPWSRPPFAPTNTQAGPFTRGDGSQVTANMMHGRADVGDFGYTATGDATYVSLPLAGDQLKVVVALPKSDVASLASSLTPAAWASAWAALEAPIPRSSSGADHILQATMPKFTFDTRPFSLKHSLQQLGMKQAFEGGAADFSKMCTNPECKSLYIADVLQRATVGVSEQGVEAAAATAVIAGATGIPLPAPEVITVTLDHPFLFSIVDSTGAILFLGQLNDPTDAFSP